MLSILGSLLGFASSAIPQVANHLKEGNRNKHELEMMRLQIESADKAGKFTLDKYAKEANDNEHARLLEHSMKMETSGFVGGLRASVRPVITYFFFLMFVAVKGSALYAMLVTGEDIPTAISLVWDEDTGALFAAVISFWFGSRAISKYNNAKP